MSRIRVEFTLNISYRLIRRRDDPRNPSFGFEYIRDNLKRRREKRMTISSLSPNTRMKLTIILAELFLSKIKRT